MFIAFSLDLKSPGWAMTTVYLTSQPLSGVLRAKAAYRVIGTLVGGAAMVAIVPNLIDAPELTAVAIIIWVALCAFVSLLDRTPRSYMFVLSGYTAALIGFPSVLAPETVFDTAVSRVEEIALGVVCAAIVHSLIFPKSAFSAFEEKLRSAMTNAHHWLADGLVRQATPQTDMERRQIAADITELYLLGTSFRFDTSPHRPDIGMIRAFDRKMVALLPLLSAIEDRLTLLRRLGPLDSKLSRTLAGIHDWLRLDQGRAAELKEACVAAMPAIGPQSSWADLVTVNLLVRLSELIEFVASLPRLYHPISLIQRRHRAPTFVAPPRSADRSRCTRIRASRHYRHWRRPSRWAYVPSFGSQRHGRKAPAQSPLPR